MSNEQPDGWTGTWCPQCGSGVSIDEDGLCNHCGCTAVGDGAEEALAAIAEVERLKLEQNQAVDTYAASIAQAVAAADAAADAAEAACRERDASRAEPDRLRAMCDAWYAQWHPDCPSEIGAPLDLATKVGEALGWWKKKGK
jgi:hypothetical protein